MFANVFFIYDKWEVTFYLWYYFHIFLSILPSANGVAVSRLSRFWALCVRMGQSLRGGPHIFPSSSFFINRKQCVETGVRHLLSIRTVYKWGPRTAALFCQVSLLIRYCEFVLTRLSGRRRQNLRTGSRCSEASTGSSGRGEWTHSGALTSCLVKCQAAVCGWHNALFAVIHAA